MQYTSNYNLMLPEGTDTVNLLTQMNPNTSDIDAALFANKQAVVGRATELTAGTVHAITRANPDSPVFAFTATSNWTAGDTMAVDGSACTVYLSDGTTPATGAYIINTEVLAILNGTRVTLVCSGATVQAINAADVVYDNTASELAATDVQEAIDELAYNAKNKYSIITHQAAVAGWDEALPAGFTMLNTIILSTVYSTTSRQFSAEGVNDQTRPSAYLHNVNGVVLNPGTNVDESYTVKVVLMRTDV